VSIASLELQRAHPHLLANRMMEIIRAEAMKGCQAKICPYVVELEPPFAPPSRWADEVRPVDHVPAIRAPAPTKRDWIRSGVWISPNSKFDWSASERFLKLIPNASNRIAVELFGNREAIHVQILCHREDFQVLDIAFRSQFPESRLRQVATGGISTIPDESWQDIVFHDYFPPPPYSHRFTQPRELRVSPYSAVLVAISQVPTDSWGLYQVVYQRTAAGHNWHHNIEYLRDLEFRSKTLDSSTPQQRYPLQSPSADLHHEADEVEEKAHNDKPILCVALRTAVIGLAPNRGTLLDQISVGTELFRHGGQPLVVLNELDYCNFVPSDAFRDMFVLGTVHRPGFLANSLELASMAHLPPATIAEESGAPLELLDPLTPTDALQHGTQIGVSNMAGEEVPVAIPPEHRLTHVQLVGRSGKGKSTLMESMILQDIEIGHGVVVIDPHGPLVQRIMQLIPPNDVERTIYVNPGDANWIPLWNPLAADEPDTFGTIADDIVQAFKAFVDGWGDRLEHLLRHAILALLHLPGTCLQDVYDLLRKSSKASSHLRKRILAEVDNPVVQSFWSEDFGGYRRADVAPPLHKLGKLLSAGSVARMLSQPECRFSFRDCIRAGQIVLIDISTTPTGIRSVIGCLFLSLLHSEALRRGRDHNRTPFHIYVDEAHRFHTDSLEEILAETRKFDVSMILAHQRFQQFDVKKADALASIGSTVIFNVHGSDARRLHVDLQGRVAIEDLTALPSWEAIARIDTEIVRIKTLPPRQIDSQGEETRSHIIKTSRDRYYANRTEMAQPSFRTNRRESASSARSPIVVKSSEAEPEYDEFK